METLTKKPIGNLELARQLRCPTGKGAGEFGRSVYNSNRGMIIDSITSLGIKKGNRLLELGPGIGAHLPLVFEQDSRLRYFGLDISQAMVDEAMALNHVSITQRRALFLKYDGANIPYVNNFFDRVLTVNTIYFWERPRAFLNEIHRVLKPEGTCVVAFITENSMKGLPFLNDSFDLFDIPKFVKLVSSTRFKSVDIQTRHERTPSKDGTVMDREFIVAILQKGLKRPDVEHSNINFGTSIGQRRNEQNGTHYGTA